MEHGPTRRLLFLTPHDMTRQRRQGEHIPLEFWMWYRSECGRCGNGYEPRRSGPSCSKEAADLLDSQTFVGEAGAIVTATDTVAINKHPFETGQQITFVSNEKL